MLQVSQIQSSQALLSLRSDWNSLFNQSNSTIFQSWEWQSKWWEYYGGRKKLSVLVVREKNKPIGIAPFFIASNYLGMPVKIISFLGIGPSDYGHFILKKGCERDAIDTILTYLIDSTSINAIDLHQVPEKSSEIQIIRDLAKEKGLEYRELAQDTSYSISLPSSWDELKAGLSKKFRWNVEYYNRRLNRDYKVEIIKTEDHAKLHRDMESFFRLHQMRWRSQKKPGLFFNQKYKLFHQNIAREFLKRGWLKLYFLKIDGVPVSSLYGFEHEGKFYYYLGGFNPAWGKLSVGTVLTSIAIKESIKDNVSNFDFLRGEESYKLKWKANPLAHKRFLIGKAGKRAVFIQKILTRENELMKKAKRKLQKK